MNNYSSFFKRTQAWVIALAIMLTAIHPIFGLSIFASDDAESTKAEVTDDGKIVAGNYDLTDAEKSLLGSGYLVGGSHNYNKPTASDNLIAIDTDSKTITVSSYEGAPGYVWHPTVAKVKVNGGVFETVSLTNGVGSYTYTGVHGEYVGTSISPMTPNTATTATPPTVSLPTTGSV